MSHPNQPPNIPDHDQLQQLIRALHAQMGPSNPAPRYPAGLRPGYVTPGSNPFPGTRDPDRGAREGSIAQGYHALDYDPSTNTAVVNPDILPGSGNPFAYTANGRRVTPPATVTPGNSQTLIRQGWDRLRDRGFSLPVRVIGGAALMGAGLHGMMMTGPMELRSRANEIRRDPTRGRISRHAAWMGMRALASLGGAPENHQLFRGMRERANEIRQDTTRTWIGRHAAWMGMRALAATTGRGQPFERQRTRDMTRRLQVWAGGVGSTHYAELPPHIIE